MKSADSFGMFHLLRVLYKDYLFFLVQKRLSVASGQPLICMFGNFKNDQLNEGIEDSNLITYELETHNQQTAVNNDTNATYVIVDQLKYPEINQVAVYLFSRSNKGLGYGSYLPGKQQLHDDAT